MCNGSNFANYRILIAPFIIKLAAWIGIVITFLIGLKLLITDDRFPFAVLVMLGGPVAVRVLSEILLAPFLILDKTNKS